MKSIPVFLTLLLTFLIPCSIFAQSEPHYYQLEDYPNGYTSGLVAARLVDGLGYRFYWATDSLTAENLRYAPGEDARSIEETVDHIYNLVVILRNALEEKPTEFPINIGDQDYDQKRATILDNIQVASGILQKSSDDDFQRYQMVFQSSDGSKTTYPFWNLLNGPIADALWHTGQIVSFRRSAGNPFTTKASMLRGKVRP